MLKVAWSCSAVVEPVGTQVTGVVSVAGVSLCPAVVSVHPSGQCTVRPVSGSVYEPAVSGRLDEAAHCAEIVASAPPSPTSASSGNVDDAARGGQASWGHAVPAATQNSAPLQSVQDVGDDAGHDPPLGMGKGMSPASDEPPSSMGHEGQPASWLDAAPDLPQAPTVPTPIASQATRARNAAQPTVRDPPLIATCSGHP